MIDCRRGADPRPLATICSHCLRKLCGARLAHKPGFFDKRFGESGEVSGFQGLRPGLSAQSSQVGNVEYVTFAQNDAAAASVTATSGASSISKSAAAVHSGSVTIAIDFTSGSIQLMQTDALATSTATQINRTA